jgi:RHS repeat-associated protein
MGYDEAGRVKSVPGFVSDLTWDALGRPDTKTNANGVFTDWTWSPNRGLLDRIKTTTAGGAILQDLTYTQRAAGLVQSVTSPVAGEGWTYDYDELYHLTTATNHSYPGESQTFDYDAGGRIQTNSRVGVYTYATRRHRPQTVGGSTLVYDANGNLVSGGGRAPVWNAENLITQIGTTQFKYDALGERVKKTSGTTTSLYPFGDDYEITNGVVTKYISIEGVGVVAKKVTGGSSPGVYWFLSDHLGSLQGVLDINGAAISRRTYRPYGQTLGQSGSHTESRGWIDQRNDSETGLTYLHARYFDPQLGTFLSADPIGVEGGINQYAYGFGDPVNWADRSGFSVSPCEPDGGVCPEHPADGLTPDSVPGGPDQGGLNPLALFKLFMKARSWYNRVTTVFGWFSGGSGTSDMTGPNMALPPSVPPPWANVPTGPPVGWAPPVPVSSTGGGDGGTGGGDGGGGGGGDGGGRTRRFPAGPDYIIFTPDSGANSGTAHWMLDDGTVFLSLNAVSGPFGQGRLPDGHYTGRNLRSRTRQGMVCPGSPGWSLDLEPRFRTTRTLLRIHPDQRPAGTDGCIGMQCGLSNDAMKMMLDIWFGMGNTSIDVYVVARP